jgi:hypothetical protein
MSAPDMPADGSTTLPDGGPVPGDVQSGPRPARTRTWIVVVLIAIAVVIGAVTVVLVVAGDTGIHDGPGTATFTWTSVPEGSSAIPRPQPFSADIDGMSLTGNATFVLDYKAIGLPGGHFPTGPVPVYRYRGTFAGTPFDITISYHFPAGLIPTDSAAAPAGLYLTVAGTYGHSAIHAKVSVPSGSGPTAAHPATFTGTIGHWKVTGAIPQPTGTGSHRSATAHFVVSG